MSVTRRYYEFRRLCRHKWCYFLLFSLSFLGFVLTVSYHWEALEKQHHDGHQDVHRNKVDLIGRKAAANDDLGQTNNDDLGEADNSALEGRPGEYAASWGNPSATTVLKQGIFGNYEHYPDLRSEKGRRGPGEQGKPVPADGNDSAVNRANAEFGFNSYASDKVSLNRSIPDTRPEECQYWHYPPMKQLPHASVVIVFHNEGWSPLMRTVHSVILRSPKELLHEVVMVDDYSNKEHLKSKLDRYIRQFNGLVRLVRNTQREGLIRSRSIGAENSRGDVVVFLDAHCEANHNWLPPLLAPIAEDRKVMTVPVIDGIDQNNWSYRKQYGGQNSLFRGIFEWGLLYKESEITEQEIKRRTQQTEPFRSPTHAGGLFAIDRRWFKQLGYYDPGLQIWGGEQYELSFKIWQCGGGILFVPCSRVGHVYRNRMPYSFGKLRGPIVAINHKRVAAVWMDEYMKYYLRREPGIVHHDHGDISKQLEIRRKNHCKSFKWYMENVAYDVETKYPVQPENQAWGRARNPDTNMCIDAMGQPVPGTLGVSGCHGFGGNQLFRLNVKGQMVSGEWCVTSVNGRFRKDRCPFGSVSGKWNYDHETKHITHDVRDCATVDNDRLVLKRCDLNNLKQQWEWKEIYS